MHTCGVMSRKYRRYPHLGRVFSSEDSWITREISDSSKRGLLMELAEAAVLANLLSNQPGTGTRKPYVRRVGLPFTKKHLPVPKRQVCTCGECVTCLENAKWDQ